MVLQVGAVVHIPLVAEVEGLLQLRRVVLCVVVEVLEEAVVLVEAVVILTVVVHLEVDNLEGILTRGEGAVVVLLLLLLRGLSWVRYYCSPEQKQLVYSLVLLWHRSR